MVSDESYPLSSSAHTNCSPKKSILALSPAPFLSAFPRWLWSQKRSLTKKHFFKCKCLFYFLYHEQVKNVTVVQKLPLGVAGWGHFQRLKKSSDSSNFAVMLSKHGHFMRKWLKINAFDGCKNEKSYKKKRYKRVSGMQFLLSNLSLRNGSYEKIWRTRVVRRRTIRKTPKTLPFCQMPSGSHYDTWS